MFELLLSEPSQVGEGERRVDGKLMPRQQEEVATGNLFFFSCCYPGTVSEDVGELLRDAKRKGSAEGAGAGAMPASL